MAACSGIEKGEDHYASCLDSDCRVCAGVVSVLLRYCGSHRHACSSISSERYRSVHCSVLVVCSHGRMMTHTGARSSNTRPHTYEKESFKSLLRRLCCM